MSLLLIVLFPWVLAVALLGRPFLQRCSIRLAPFASLALLVPVWYPTGFVAEGTLLGLSLQVDTVSRPLLLLTGLVWSLAAWQAQTFISADQRWFWSGWLGALAGMSLLLLAGDMASFYVGYAVLSLAAYLLITHARSESAWRAGRVYLVMALTGEAAILAGVCLLAGQLGNATFEVLAQSPEALLQSPARWLLLGGFAIKLGMIPLHLWLPLAHPVAPIPASAILSAVIVKAGLLGCLRLVPPLALDPHWIGYLLLILGLTSAFGGVLLGLGQNRIKTVLAYSTISQMGLITSTLALQFLIPEQREWLLGIIGLLALHHGLNKAALFIACGQSPGLSRWRLLLFALPAISLAAAPLSTGALAKLALKDAYTEAGLASAFVLILSLSSAATAALMWKAFGLARKMREARPMHPAWPIIVLAALIVPWLQAATIGAELGLQLARILDALWPLALAAVLVTLLLRTRWRQRWKIPEGDLIVPIEVLLKQTPAIAQTAQRSRSGNHDLPERMAPILRRLERQQQRIPAAGLAMLLTGAVLWLLVSWLGGA